MNKETAENFGRIYKARAIALQIVAEADKLLELPDISVHQFDEFRDLTRSFMGPMAKEYGPMRSRNHRTPDQLTPQEPKHQQPRQTQQS